MKRKFDSNNIKKDTYISAKYQKKNNIFDILTDIEIEDTFIFICQKCEKECVGFLDTNKIYKYCIFCI
jgi:hypothetical protein